MHAAPATPAVKAVACSVPGARYDFTTVGTAPRPRAAMPIAMARSPEDSSSTATAVPASARQIRSSPVARQYASRLATDAATMSVGTTATAPVSTAGSNTPWLTWPAQAIHAVSPLTNQVTRFGRTRPCHVP